MPRIASETNRVTFIFVLSQSAITLNIFPYSVGVILYQTILAYEVSEVTLYLKRTLVPVTLAAQAMK